MSRALVLVIATAVAWAGAIVIAEQRPPVSQTTKVQDLQQTTKAASPQDPRERFEIVSIRQSIPARNVPAGARGIGTGGALEAALAGHRKLIPVGLFSTTILSTP